MKKILTILAIVIIILTIGISLKSNADKSLINYTIEDINKFLTDKNLEGRLTGTMGNKKAEEFISEYFKSLNLETLEDNTYLFPYSHNFVEFGNQDIKMLIEYENGNTKECIIGKDFLPRSYKKEVNINAPVSKQLDEKSFLLVDNNIKQEYQKAKGILIKAKIFHHYINITDNKPVIQISEDLYNNLSNNQCNIKLSYTLNTEQIEANNVVGKISGEDNNSAIILTAHFDHIGKIGDTIYYGALDNSSGVSILLDLSKKLKEYSEKNRLKQDIILCAFNGEESGRQGSKAFTTFINSKYQNITNINFDCIGFKNSTFAISESIDFKDKNSINNNLYNFLKNKNYSVIFNDSCFSDDSSFAHYHIPAVGIGQPEFDIIHSKLDTIDKLDMDLIQKFSDDMFEFLTTNNNTNYSETINTSNNFDVEYVDEVEESEYEKMIKLEAENLELNQYKHIMSNSYPTCIRKKSKTYNSLENLKKIFNNISIPENIANYDFNEITINCDDMSEVTIGEIDKIYAYDNFSVFCIHNISIKYLDKDDTNKLLTIDIFKTDKKCIDNLINTNKDSSLKREKISDNNQNYWIEYNECENMKPILGVINITENNNIFYIIRINKQTKTEDLNGHKLDWFNHSSDKTIEFMKNIDFNKLINSIFE